MAVALLIAGPLLTGTGGETFFLNLIGLGIVALVVRRIVRANERRRAAQARQANCRCRCHRQQQPNHSATGRHAMTTITLESPASTTGRLEDLVDRLLATLFSPDSEQTEPALTPSLVKAVHEGRRLRQSGDLEGALAVFAGVDTANATETQIRWLYAEWLDIARRRFAGDKAVLYSPGTGRAAVLVTCEGNGATLAVAAVLGMRWPVGKLVSRLSLRGLKPLAKGGASW